MIKIKINKSIIFEIKVLDNMINRKVITDTKQAKFPFVLSPVQLKILHYLYIHQDKIIYQRDIEKLIESRRSTTSGILNTMEKNNLINRIHSEKDARSKQVILTNYSKETSKYMVSQKKKFDKKIKENISEEELTTFFMVTEKIKNNIMNMK
ncbi:MAG: MarR family winged helix-turn-helix transcriptional regulator [Erysipelotrichaceae bacterium]|nr:MarR family winged helix-turn-helix transcriptional regulator [Erysipelotrichaceae bacterium]